jgi:small GTP-binding protein
MTDDDSKKFLYKILVLGDGSVGKTALMTRFTDGVFKEDYKMTIGVQFQIKKININNNMISLQIWDFAGQERFKFMLNAYAKGAKGALILFDLTRYGTFKPGIEKWMDLIKSSVGDIPFLIIGNKADLSDLREVNSTEATQFARENNSWYFETSAKTGEQVQDSFFKLTEIILEKYNPDKFAGISDLKFEPVEEITPDYDKEGFKLTDEMKELINKNVERILSSTPAEDEGFRFLIMGNEQAEVSFVAQLLRVEKLVWPPNDLDILYNTTQIKNLNIARKEYNFQVYLLSNLQKLNEKKDLFIKAVENSNGVVIFFDDQSPNLKDFKFAADTAILLRKMFPDLEIILTAGHETSGVFFKELEELEEDYDIYFENDIETLLPNLLINTLKRKKKIDRKKQFLMEQLKIIQEKIQSKQVNTEFLMDKMKNLIESIDDQKLGEISTKTESKPATEKLISTYAEEISELGKNFVFISYSTRDSDIFKISKIVELLEQDEKIDKVLYWEKDSGMNIVEYMDKNLGKSKVFLLLCTENSINSKSVKAEWMAAFQLMQLEKLSIIPIYQDPEYIPSLLLPYIRIYYDQNDLETFLVNVKKEILKKL